MKKADFKYTSQPLKQNWDQELPRYWFDGSPLKTHFMNGMSIVVPILEYSVIHTLKDSQKFIKDPELKAQVLEMIAQENWHAYSHRKYNMWLAEQGLPSIRLSSKFMKEQQRAKKVADRIFGQRFWLSAVIAGEHNIAVFIDYLFKRPHLIEQMHPHFRQAFVWHFLEELEHKGTSMDIWYESREQENRKKWRLNVTVFLQAIAFDYRVLRNMFALLRHDKQLWKWRTLKDGMSFFFGSDGMFFKTFSTWAQFFRSDFHPWDHDNSHLLNQYSKLFVENDLTEKQLKRIQTEFEGCISDINNVIEENNKVTVI
jgi:predicted metal-dependent hydrolase